MSVEAYLVDGVHVRLRPARNLGEGVIVAAAKREPFALPGLDLMGEPGVVVFEFGTDKAHLVDNLVAEVKAASS